MMSPKECARRISFKVKKQATRAAHRKSLRASAAARCHTFVPELCRLCGRWHVTLAALALVACGATPGRPVPRAPLIPTTAHETWRCAASGSPPVLVVGTPEPTRVEVGGSVLDCRLVPIGD
jgi:hypothetical protein